MAVLPGLADPALLTAQELYAPSPVGSEGLSTLTVSALAIAFCL